MVKGSGCWLFLRSENGRVRDRKKGGKEKLGSSWRWRKQERKEKEGREEQQHSQKRRGNRSNAMNEEEDDDGVISE
jgi:hypothetical protein